MAMIRCTACGYQIPAEAFRDGKSVPCPLCRRGVEAVVLPAIVRRVAGPPTLPAEPPGPGEAACFYNPERKATETCSHCGVFMSAAWAAKWGSETICLKCLEELRNRRKDARFEARRTLWDNLALGSALLPFLFLFLLTLLGPLGPLGFEPMRYFWGAVAIVISVVTAPTSLGLVFMSWNRPRSLVPRGRLRILIALVLGLLQCAVLGILIAALVSHQLKLDSDLP